MWLQRAAAPRLLRLAGHFPAVLVTGARQAGKTSLLRQTFPGATFISLDLPSAAEQAEESPGDLLDGLAGAAILDEIQYAPKAFRHLKARIDSDRHRNGRFLMTGSQKFSLMQSVSESLAGRCAILELDTLSSLEILGGLGRRAPPLPALVWRGGFPAIYRDTRLPVREFFSSYVVTYLERDVRGALRASSLRDFERFIRGCAIRSGQLLNLSDLARDVGIAVSTARDWISVLEASNVIVLLEPWFGNLGKRMIKTPKLYFRDTGLLCFLLGFETPESWTKSASVGAIWETFVLGQILRAQQAAATAGRVFFYRDVQGTEVDFVIEAGEALRLVEVRWSESRIEARSLGALRHVQDLLGPRAAAKHWVATRTDHPRAVAGAPGVRIIDASRFAGWFGSVEGA
jgi:hypothetical protein